MNKKSRRCSLSVFVAILFVAWSCLVQADRGMNMHGHDQRVERRDFGRGMEHRHDEGRGDYLYQGRHYRYYHDGGYYNYFHKGAYYVYFIDGTYYNYVYRGRYYRDCRPNTAHRDHRHPTEEMECR